jgi:hypothetical protein
MRPQRLSLLLLSTFLAVSAAHPASAQRITRCVDPASGNVTYSNTRCVPATPDEIADGPCHRQAEIALKEQVPYARGGVDVALPEVAIERRWVEMRLSEITERESSSVTAGPFSRPWVDRWSSVTRQFTPEVHREREMATGGLVRASPEVVARGIRRGLSARCRAILDKQGPTGPEWYGAEAWNTLRAETAARDQERAIQSEELRRQLHALLVKAQEAHGIIVSGGSHETFAREVEVMRQQQESIRGRYALPLKAGEHQALGRAVAETCTALFAVDADLRRERDTATIVATAEATAVTYRETRNLSVPARRDADRAEQWLARARQEHDQARSALASRLDRLAGALSEAIRIAAERRPPGHALDRP